MLKARFVLFLCFFTISIKKFYDDFCWCESLEILCNESEISSRTSNWGLIFLGWQMGNDSVCVWLRGKSSTCANIEITFWADIIWGHVLIHDLDEKSGLRWANGNFQNIVELNSVILFFGLGRSLNNLCSELSSLVSGVVQDNNGNIVLHLASNICAFQELAINYLQSECHIFNLWKMIKISSI